MDGALKGRGKEPPRQLGLGHSSPRWLPAPGGGLGGPDWSEDTDPRRAGRARWFAPSAHSGQRVGLPGALRWGSEAKPEPRSIVINARICHGRGAGEHLCQG